MRSFKIYGIWLQAEHIYIHTTSANAVTLVWALLRLAPIIRYVNVHPQIHRTILEALPYFEGRLQQMSLIAREEVL